MMITKERLGEIRKDFHKGPYTEFFEMMDSDLSLKVTLNYHVSIVLNHPVFSCYANFELFRKSGNNNSLTPLVKFTGNAPRTDEISPCVPDDIALAHFNLTGSRSGGFHLHFDQVEIQGIHFSEGERLLAFFKQMYGVRLNYLADILGFLNQSGDHERLTFLLPYPVYELA